MRYGVRATDATDLLDMYTRTRHDGFGPEVKRRIMLGTYALSSGYYDAYYGRAQRVRTKIAEDFKAAFADVDLIVTPTSANVAFALGEKTADPWSMYLSDFFTVPMSLAGIPAISIPCGLGGQGDAAGPDGAGLPVGLQIAGPAFSENRLLDAAHALEQAIGFEGAGACLTARRRRRGAGTAAGAPALEPVIGLEIHVQLATATKMFCGCALSFGEPPNTHTCPICLGLPGSLPVANERAVHFGLMIGHALGSELAPRSIFHRKNYFYPDLPKGYQISQYDEPLCLGGRLGDVRIHRVHLEEDAAKLIHVGESGRIHGSDASVVDFNRGGTPLAEIVTEPDLRSPEQAGEWLRLLRATLRQLGVSDVNMEEGSLRCDANISLRPAGSDELGVKTELKNMNSFRFIERGIRAEIERQRAIIESGETVVQETLHFDPASGRDHVAALEGGGARLPLLPRAGPAAGGDRRGDARRGARGDVRAAGAAGRALPARARAERRQRPAAGVSQRARRLLRGGARAHADPPPPAQALANWISGDLAARLGEGEDPADSRVQARARWRRSSASWRPSA